MLAVQLLLEWEEAAALQFEQWPQCQGGRNQAQEAKAESAPCQDRVLLTFRPLPECHITNSVRHGWAALSHLYRVRTV